MIGAKFVVRRSLYNPTLYNASSDMCEVERCSSITFTTERVLVGSVSKLGDSLSNIETEDLAMEFQS